MNSLEQHRPVEASPRPRNRRATAAGGAVLLGVIGCSIPTPPDYSRPVKTVHTTQPTCTVTGEPVKDKRYEYRFRVDITNPDEVNIPEVTYDFGHGTKETYKTHLVNAKFTPHTFPDVGRWRVFAIMNIVPPENTAYSFSATDIPCDPVVVNIN